MTLVCSFSFQKQRSIVGCFSGTFLGQELSQDNMWSKEAGRVLVAGRGGEVWGGGGGGGEGRGVRMGRSYLIQMSC